MKYLRTYELFTPDGEWNHKPGTGNEIDYAIGDTVICVEGTKIPKGLNRLPRLEEGKEYKVVNLYQAMKGAIREARTHSENKLLGETL